MKNLLLSSILFVVAITNTLAQNNIELTVRNVKIDNGDIMVALCNSAEDFPDTIFRKVKIESNSKDVKILFNNVPNGDYAIAIYQDEDGNGELTSGLFGPKEPYAFSNDATGMFGPAKFSDAKFEVKNNDVKVSIDMK